jgi:hypothetical protein
MQVIEGTQSGSTGLVCGRKLPGISGRCMRAHADRGRWRYDGLRVKRSRSRRTGGPTKYGK